MLYVFTKTWISYEDEYGNVDERILNSLTNQEIRYIEDKYKQHLSVFKTINGLTYILNFMEKTYDSDTILLNILKKAGSQELDHSQLCDNVLSYTYRRHTYSSSECDEKSTPVVHVDITFDFDISKIKYADATTLKYAIDNNNSEYTKSLIEYWLQSPSINIDHVHDLLRKIQDEYDISSNMLDNYVSELKKYLYYNIDTSISDAESPRYKFDHLKLCCANARNKRNICKKHEDNLISSDIKILSDGLIKNIQNVIDMFNAKQNMDSDTQLFFKYIRQLKRLYLTTEEDYTESNSLYNRFDSKKLDSIVHIYKTIEFYCNNNAIKILLNNVVPLSKYTRGRGRGMRC